MRFVNSHHMAITTPDFARLRAFYVETLGLPVVGGFPGQDIVCIRAGGIAIELIGESAPPAERVNRAGWNHLAWEVEDVDASHAELTALGVAFRTPPEDFPSE